MKLFILFKNLFKQLFLDLLYLLGQFFRFLLKEFKELEIYDQIIIISGFIAMITLAFPMFNYKIFDETHSIHHPHFYLAPLGFLILFTGSVLDFPQRIIAKGIGFLPFLIVVITSIFPRIIIPETIPAFSYSPGFWVEIASVAVLIFGLILSLKD